MRKTGIFIYSLLFLAFAGIMTETVAAAPKDKFVVAVDAGHGGKDIGASDNGAREKDINLGVALELSRLIEKKMKDSEVVMTRDDDRYLTLQQRADIANKAKANLFVSIHTNSVDKSNKNRKTVEGSSVYVLGLHKDASNMAVARRENSVIELEENFEERYAGFDPSKDESYIIFEMAQKKNLNKSIRLAKDIQKNLALSGRTDRGVHQAGFWVLWATSMPSVLVELDFICNPESAKYMTSQKGRKQLAESIFKAIEAYEKSFRERKNHSALSDNPSMTESTTDFAETTGSGANSQKEDSGTTDSRVKNKTSSFSEGDGVAVLAKVEKVKKMENGPAYVNREGGGSYASARRRRSRTAKESSDNKNFETASITVRDADERLAQIESPVTQTDVSDNGDDSDRDQVSKGKDKKKKDKKKKDKKKKDKKDKKNKKSNPSHKAKREKFVTVYKIQVLASEDDIEADSPRFCGLTPISSFKENNLIKYTYGESQNKSEIEALLKEVRAMIPDAFIIKSIKSK